MGTQVWTAEEQKAHRKLWVEALRSGEYQQGRAVLRDKNGAMCCLGVACDISGAVTWEPLTSKGEFGETIPCGFAPKIDGRELGRFYAPGLVRDWLGLGSEHGAFSKDGSSESLADLNDSGKSFIEIADIIESEPVGLIAQPTEAA